MQHRHFRRGERFAERYDIPIIGMEPALKVALRPW